MLKRILKSHFNDLEVALNQWHLWVVWRHGIIATHTNYYDCTLNNFYNLNFKKKTENSVDEISEEDIVNEKNEGTMKWRGI